MNRLLDAITNGSAAGSTSLDELAASIEDWLIGWIVKRAGVERKHFTSQSSLVELGVDSLSAVELSQVLEDRFQVDLTPDVAWSHPTPQALSRWLAEQTLATRRKGNAASEGT